MIISKEYIGKHENVQSLTHYYMIKNDSLYGIELVEEKESKITSNIEWISESQEKTLTLIKRLCSAGCSSIHLSEIIDDYVD